MSEFRMPHISQIAVAGRLVQDSEFRFMDNGVARLTGSIAFNRPYRDRNNEWQEETSFFNIVLWHKLAEYYAERLHKGTPLFITGRLRSYNWRDADDQPHSGTEIWVRTLQLLEKSQERTLEVVEQIEEEDLDWKRLEPDALRGLIIVP